MDVLPRGSRQDNGKKDSRSCLPTHLGNTVVRNSQCLSDNSDESVLEEPRVDQFGAILSKLELLQRKLDQLLESSLSHTNRSHIDEDVLLKGCENRFSENRFSAVSASAISTSASARLDPLPVASKHKYSNLSGLPDRFSNLSGLPQMHEKNPHSHLTHDPHSDLTYESYNNEETQEIDAGETRSRPLKWSRSLTQSAAIARTTIRKAREFNLKLAGLLDDPNSSHCAWMIQAGMVCIIMSSVLLTLVQTTEQPLFDTMHAAIIDTVFDSIFILEVLLRFFACPNRSRFLFSGYNVIDILSVFTLTLRITTGFAAPRTQGDYTTANYVLVAFVPTLRLVKMLRRSKHLRLLLYAMQDGFEALVVPLFVLLLIELAFSGFIYVLEPRDNIHSLPHAMWLVVVTISTVGYGATVPSTVGGFLVTAVLVAGGVLYMALPMSIVGMVWGDIWSKRFEILLMDQIKDRLGQQGFTCSEIQQFFQKFDDDRNGLDIHEFTAMLSEMQLGLSFSSVIKLFEALDKDQDGFIDQAEFLRVLFPTEYLEHDRHQKSLKDSDGNSAPELVPEKKSSQTSKTSTTSRIMASIQRVSGSSFRGVSQKLRVSRKASDFNQDFPHGVERMVSPSLHAQDDDLVRNKALEIVRTRVTPPSMVPDHDPTDAPSPKVMSLTPMCHALTDGASVRRGGGDMIM